MCASREIVEKGGEGWMRRRSSSVVARRTRMCAWNQPVTEARAHLHRAAACQRTTSTRANTARKQKASWVREGEKVAMPAVDQRYSISDATDAAAAAACVVRALDSRNWFRTCVYICAKRSTRGIELTALLMDNTYDKTEFLFTFFAYLGQDSWTAYYT